MSVNRKNNLFRKGVRKANKLALKFRAKFFRLNRPLHNNEDIKPFFIVGSGRSGNTLLRRILNNHEDLYIPPETYMLGKSIRQYLFLPFLPWTVLTKTIYRNFLTHPEFSTFGISSLDALLKRVADCPKKERSLAYALDGFYQEYARSNSISSQRWGDKTPLNTFFMEEIHAVFPKAKFIHMLRNPYDVVASYLDTGLYKNEEEALNRWLESVIAVKEFRILHPDVCVEVRYETLVSNPGKVVDKVCSFLEIDFGLDLLAVKDEEMILGDVVNLKHHANVMNPISQDSIGKGKRRLSEEQISRMKAIIAMYLPSVGEDCL